MSAPTEEDGIPALLVERLDPDQPMGRLDELSALARAAGYRVVATATQHRRTHPSFQVGRGKAEELAELARGEGASRVLFANTLSASQAFHLEETLGMGVGDRGDVILEIFSRRARTPEARLQVELAQAIYELPRARAKVRGRVGEEQPGFMGLGRFGYDVYERHLRRRIAGLRRELAAVGARDAGRRGRHRREGFDLVAMAGYTNAGKSSLLNALTAATADVSDDVFTTLSPTTRAADLGGRRVLLTDTVGFIRDLPPFLLRAFRTTLEEVLQADLAVVVADAGEPPEELARKLAATMETLRAVGLRAPMTCALNKADLLADADRASRREAALSVADGAFRAITFTSARTGEGLVELLAAVEAALPPWRRGEVPLPSQDGGALLARLHREGRVVEMRGGVAVWEAPAAAWGRLAKAHRAADGDGEAAREADAPTAAKP